MGEDISWVEKGLTVGASKLVDGVDEAIMELDGPAKSGLGIGGKDEP